MSEFGSRRGGARAPHTDPRWRGGRAEFCAAHTGSLAVMVSVARSDPVRDVEPIGYKAALQGAAALTVAQCDLLTELSASKDRRLGPLDVARHLDEADYGR